MKWAFGNKIFKEYLYPDNFNKQGMLFLICILLFWYSTCAISGLTENRYFYVSSALLNDLGKESKAKTILALIAIFLTLVWGAFNKKALRLLMLVLFCDLFFSNSSPLDDYWFHYFRNHPNDSVMSYLCKFFDPVIPTKAVKNILPLSNENAIGKVYFWVAHIGFFMCSVLAGRCLGWKWKS